MLGRSPSASEQEEDQAEDKIGERIAEQFQPRPRKLPGEIAERRLKAEK
jgi:hypothetical protein